MRRLPAALLCASALAATSAGCGLEETTAVAEPAAAGEAVRLDRVHYSVPLARVLDPEVRRDERLIHPRHVAERRRYVGVALQACNDGDRPRRVRPSVTLSAPPYDRGYAAVELPRRNRFAWEPRMLEPGACRPGPGPSGERFARGSVVVFELPPRTLRRGALVLRLRQGDAVREIALGI